MEFADTDIKLDPKTFEGIDELKDRLDRLRPLPRDALRKIREDIRLRHTYHSEGMEGNTLNLNETKLVLEEGITIGGKPLKDHISVKNDAEAFDLMMEMVNGKRQVDHVTIQELHSILTRGVLKEAGCYRTTNVRIIGSPVSPPPYGKVVMFMDRLFQTLSTSKMHPIARSAFLHHSLVRIHPFVDGNGRVARLAMNLSLMREGYAPILLFKEDRRIYYQALRKADKGDLKPLLQMMIRSETGSLMLYLSAFLSGDELIPLKDLAKGSPYSQEYLSLRARQGILIAAKIDGVWHSSKNALKDYTG
jgi:Fic family protein